MVLWALVLLSLLATIFGGNARTEVLLARNLVENAQAEALADAGLYRAIAGLTKEPREGGFHGDGRVYNWHTNGGEVRFSIRDEGGKIDINQAPEMLLQQLFVAVGVDPKRSAELADAIVDFRDEDSDKRPHGAEKEEYVAAGLPYGPKNKPFELVDELIYVLGMTPVLYRKVAPLVSVRGKESPHVYTAAPEVRAAMIATQATPRHSGDSTSGGIIRMDANASATNLSTTLRGSHNIADPALSNSTASDSDAAETAEERNWRRSDRSGVPIFTVHVEGCTQAGTVYVREATVSFTGSDDLPFVFSAWRQAARQLFPTDEPAGG